MELIIGKVFDISLGISSLSPEVRLFKRFQEYWGFIDRNKFETGLKENNIKLLLEDTKDEILEFATRKNSSLTSSTHGPRDDYLEFVELVISFLGGITVRGIQFMLPGDMHHARWMSKVIYSLNIFIFRSQFKLTKKEKRGLRDICVFIVRIYFKAWKSASVTETSPYNDFQLMNSLLDCLRIHEEIAKSDSEKFSKHLWYLLDFSGLSLFDSRVPFSTKRKVVEALQNKKGTQNPEEKRVAVSLQKFHEKKFEDFVTKESFKLLKEVNLP